MVFLKRSAKFVTYDEQLAAFFRLGVNLANTVNTADFFTVTYIPTVKFYPFGSARSPYQSKYKPSRVRECLYKQHGLHHEIVITGGPAEDIAQLLAASKCVICTNGILKTSLQNVAKEILAKIAAFLMVRSHRSFPTVPLGKIIVDPISEEAEFVPIQANVPKEPPSKKSKANENATGMESSDSSEESDTETTEAKVPKKPPSKKSKANENATGMESSDSSEESDNETTEPPAISHSRAAQSPSRRTPRRKVPPSPKRGSGTDRSPAPANSQSRAAQSPSRRIPWRKVFSSPKKTPERAPDQSPILAQMEILQIPNEKELGEKMVEENAAKQDAADESWMPDAAERAKFPKVYRTGSLCKKWVCTIEGCPGYAAASYISCCRKVYHYGCLQERALIVPFKCDSNRHHAK
ncbi:unnamed protein product [Caenorhabditis auriculariae]|uniref:Uncharacterized protein n=1 Tax=Caenorhabditis auriculariae TaxID=2777116 RepID=A0A8S1GSQ1_9PELO|nr:unnamed protein product [Caenorhabditis auriculariae]